MAGFSDITEEIRLWAPDMRGRLAANAPMSALSWFRAGGPAKLLFEPADEADLAYFLANKPFYLPSLVVGLGSNLLVRDGGFDGVVIRLGKAFAHIGIDGLSLTAGTGAADMQVARAAAEAGIAGFTFLRGIPGTIGGALRMNGGAYGGETKDIFISARGVRRDGRIETFDAAAMGFDYRICRAPHDVIFTSATFKGQKGDPAVLIAEMDKITESRSSSQPINARTGGSTFKNPPGHKAWQLVDQAGCRGFRIGDAQVSELHCNFLINHGKATAAEIEAVGEHVRARVKATSGIDLHWEIKRVGLPAAS